MHSLPSFGKLLTFDCSALADDLQARHLVHLEAVMQQVTNLLRAM